MAREMFCSGKNLSTNAATSPVVIILPGSEFGSVRVHGWILHYASLFAGHSVSTTYMALEEVLSAGCEATKAAPEGVSAHGA
jgi:hypothetical protein